MEPAAHVRKTSLPGVGTRYDLNTEAGQHISVVVHQDGRRIVAFHDPEDDDNCRNATPLASHEATALSRLLTPDPVAHLREYLEIDLVTEHVLITKRSPYAGRTLGATQARTRTGASVVAVLRRTAAFPSPAPDFRFASGDTLVVVGTREGVDAVAELITGG
ncbi:potassium transporter TrkA [Streptomyces sp. NBC_01387]|uniref:cation:proton antiporter regulatory subunit n=1 Tax=unclassified Streptomyces TaxID=2593676 RepID=UPI002024772E|nr:MULTISPECIES: TrkA C-terminal domain-containing protein [unclassified Streptomyces]MCX4552787.1 potassium transporter TrkA [Streptomyces sp. NBC_01500]WSC24122.1 potassium transporter TrkA [Streptomyces sp. NBC_01766]WSV58008.1 potassium transporter TrkA [Streptomyces sp. NBC_01014]